MASQVTTTPEIRQQLARAAAHTLHSRIPDPAAHTEPARRAFRRRFELQVDPDGLLDPDERERRADHALKAHMAFLRVKAMKAKAAKKAAAEAA
jgi:hypothetical protein